MAPSLRTSKLAMYSSDSLTPKTHPRIKQRVASYQTPFTRYKRLSNRLYNRFDKHGLTTGWTNSCSFNTVTNWQPVGCLFTRYSRLSIRLYNRFDNRLCRVNGVLKIPPTLNVLRHYLVKCDVQKIAMVSNRVKQAPRKTQSLKIDVEKKFLYSDGSII